MNGYVTPFTLEERLLHVAEAKRTLGTDIPWLCDTMENDLKHSLGDRPNSEFVIDPQGKVVIARQWSNPEQLREDLAGFVGKPDRRTEIADLNMRLPPPPEKAPTGIVSRVSLPGSMQPLIVAPQPSTEPHYVKLRAESGNGQIYLGFFLDPLYNVHWNNEAPALKFNVETPDGVRLAPATGQGPKVKEKADADPREFLVDLSGRSSEPLRLTVSYFACDDAETFCKRVEQEYLITLKRDVDGGNRRSGGGGRGNGRPGGNRNPQNGRMDRSAEMFERMLSRHPLFLTLDQDRDGELSATEIQAAPDRLNRLDKNGDGEISGIEFRPR